MSDILRLTGMVSGMDTDTTVQKLIELEQVKVDRAKQDKQLLEWEREQYREIASLMKSFQSSYLDVLNPNTNFRSGSAFNLYEASISVAGASSNAVSAVTSSTSRVGHIRFAEISQLATKDTYKSDASVVGDLKSNAAVDFNNVNTEVTAGNRTMTFTLDGTTKTITLTGGYTSNADLVADLNTQLGNAFPSTTIEASESAGVISYKVKNGGVVEEGHEMSVSSASATLMTAMELTNGQSNKVGMGQTVADVFGLSGSVDLTINGVSDLGIESTDTIQEMMVKINSSSANVTLSYDSTLDKFTLEANSEGTTNSISFTDTDGLLSGMKLNTHEAGKDAIFIIRTDDGDIPTSRSSNTFDIDGTRITLNETSTDEVDINVQSNAEDVKDKIVKFVEEYNKLIDAINGKVNEKRYYDYKPLTDDEKKGLEEEDEKIWQDKAKSGLLRGDSALEGITSKLRVALYEAVDGVGISLKDIGITTSPDYKSKGKLLIDEAKLTEALENKPDQVIQLFTKQSDNPYLEDGTAQERFTENGLANRINDILNDNIRTTNGKGYLIVKAGNPDSAIDTQSDLYKKLRDADEKINDLLDYLADKEARYYNQFARMEQALAQLNNQSASLLQQMGG